MLKKIIDWLKKNPKTALVLLGVLIILTVVFSSRKAKQPQPALPPASTLIKIPAFNLEVNPQPQASLPAKAEIKTVEVFAAQNYTPEQISGFFQPIATEFNFPLPPKTIIINRVPHLYWEDSPNFLTVNLESGSFSLDLHKKDNTGKDNSAAISQIDAQLIAKNWLVNHSLLAEETDYKIQNLKDQYQELNPVADSEPADAYQISYYPTVNQLLIFTTDSFDAPISVIVDRFGNILSLYYRLPALFFGQQPLPNTSSKKVLTPDQINQQISQKAPVITAVNQPDGRFVPSTENLNNLVYDKIKLGYSNDFSQGFFVPIFQLLGSAKLDNGTIVTVTAYLPALAE